MKQIVAEIRTRAWKFLETGSLLASAGYVRHKVTLLKLSSGSQRKPRRPVLNPDAAGRKGSGRWGR